MAFCGPSGKLSKALRAALIHEMGRVSLLLTGHDGKYDTRRQEGQIFLFPLVLASITNPALVLARVAAASHSGDMPLLCDSTQAGIEYYSLVLLLLV